MAEFKGKTVELNTEPSTVYARLSNFSRLSERLDELPEELRAKAGDVKFTDDSIVINSGVAGQIVLTITERTEPSRIAMAAENSPVPMAMVINIAGADTPGRALVTPVIEVEIPAIAKPFVAPKMKEAADQFGDMLANLFKA